MLYLFYGPDIKKSRERVHTTIASLLKREPDASHVRFDADSFSEDILSEHISGQGLFAGRVLIVLDHVFEDTEAKESVLKHVQDVAGSENVFILLEGVLDKKTTTKLEKYAEKAQAFDTKKYVQKRDTSIFQLTDALGSRNRKKAWIEYCRALRNGGRPEEIHGMLFWQTKTMLLVAQNATKGLKPFVVNKTKRFLDNWTEKELTQLSSQLVSTYHNARRGGTELDIALEQLLLHL